MTTPASMSSRPAEPSAAASAPHTAAAAAASFSPSPSSHHFNAGGGTPSSSGSQVGGGLHVTSSSRRGPLPMAPTQITNIGSQTIHQSNHINMHSPQSVTTSFGHHGYTHSDLRDCSASQQMQAPQPRRTGAPTPVTAGLQLDSTDRTESQLYHTDEGCSNIHTHDRATGGQREGT
jgi:hypothetical protein